MKVLSLALWAPAIGALLVALIPARQVRLIRGVALLHSLISLLLLWGLLPAFDGAAPGVQFEERTRWREQMGMSYTLGVDGLSFPLVLLASLIMAVALVASRGVTERVKGYHAWFLLLETALLGVFLSRDWTLFYMFWEASLIPVFFLINQWGGAERAAASLNFVLYTMVGSVFLLVALAVLYMVAPGHSFDMASLEGARSRLSLPTQVGLLAALVIGFGVKVPIVPMHGWLPPAYSQAPAPVSVVLSAAMSKMGAYGLIRALGLLPDAAAFAQPLLGALSVVGAIYGGMLAWRQRDLKRMVAYASLSHMSVVLLGLTAMNGPGLLGAGLMMCAHGLSAAALFLLVDALVSRTGEPEIGPYSGLFRVLPRLSAALAVALLASMGLPGLAGFMAELHTLVGGYQRWGWPVLLVGAGLLVNAATSMRTLGALLGGPTSPQLLGVSDLSGRELVSMAPLIAGLILLGVLPSAALDLMGATISGLTDLFGPG